MNLKIKMVKNANNFNAYFAKLIIFAKLLWNNPVQFLYYITMKHISPRFFFLNKYLFYYQVVIAQWLARLLATGEVPGSNPNKGKKISMKKVID